MTPEKVFHQILALGGPRPEIKRLPAEFIERKSTAPPEAQPAP
jgi:hypothetical protein